MKSPLNAQKENIEHNRNVFQGRLKQKLDSQASLFWKLSFVILINTEDRGLLLLWMMRFIPKNKFKEAKEENSNLSYQALLKPNFLKLKTDEFEGYFYPVLLHDTYGLLVNCSIGNNDNKIKSQEIEASFNNIKQEVDQYNKLYKNITIGQTKIISGWLTEEENNRETIAEECYQNIVNKPDQWNNCLYGQGKFFNSDIFEIWNPLSSYLEEHLLIIIFSDEQSFNKANKDNYFQDWMRLFCHRHKIMWTYSQSRTITDTLKFYYREVDTITKKIKLISDKNNNLAKLQTRIQEIQTILDKFTRNLLELNFLKETIEINLDGYIKLTTIIKEKAGEESDLNFLDKFSNLTETKYLKQIEKDEANMKLGLQLLESNINALRSQIELEKAERDRNFQDLIAIIGGGAATITIIDFEGNTCNRMIQSWPFKQEEKSFPCDSFLFNSIITPTFFIILLFILALSIKLIVKKIRL